MPDTVRIHIVASNLAKPNSKSKFPSKTISKPKPRDRLELETEFLNLSAPSESIVSSTATHAPIDILSAREIERMNGRWRKVERVYGYTLYCMSCSCIARHPVLTIHKNIFIHVYLYMYIPRLYPKMYKRLGYERLCECARRLLD